MSNPTDVSRAAVERLKAAIQAKRKADEALANIESAISAYEGSYLLETSASGNIIKGFENYLKPTASQLQRRNQPVVNDDDRLFSGSSVTYETSMQLLQNQRDEKARRAEAKQVAIEAQKEAMAAANQDSVPQKKRKREREESVATGDGESMRPSGNRKKNRGGDDD